MNRQTLVSLTLLFVSGLAWQIAQAQPAQLSSINADNGVQINHSITLKKQLKKAREDKGSDYKLRTEHINSHGKPIYTNRLILEDSPYLLQHAHNPVDWYAWGPEAFAKAQRENKPIFLSIGYSTCHWCHVMEKESFENILIATLINKYFVPIKVDRERRPEVDATYMSAVMLIAGYGGWPMSSFLTPEGKTFFGGSYFPPKKFRQLLRRIHALWQNDQKELLIQADRVAEEVIKLSSTREKAGKLKQSAVQQSVTNIMYAYDELLGGYSPAPKFPNEPRLFLLLNYVEHNFDKKILSSLNNTLDAMARGGIYDQIGGGFHRYSTDNHWLVPHFEKMLYNQANLSRIYLRGWKLTNNPVFEQVTRQTLDYVLRDMTAPEGGFYSATDADSEGEEGKFFLWTVDEIKNTLNKADAALALDFYSISESGDFAGRNILHLTQSLEDYAESHQMSLHELNNRVEGINQVLFKKRQQRIHPASDTKIITAWNAMMITALAQAGDMLNEPAYLTAAIRAADAIWNGHRKKDNTLWRSSLNNTATVAASQEDYAYLAESFLMLYDVSGEQRWLQRAEKLTKHMLVEFWDNNSGGFFMSSDKQRLSGMGRIKDISEGAIPSGNSVALHVLQKLSRRTNNSDYQKYTEASLSTFSSVIDRNPTLFPYMLSAANDLFNGESGAHQYAAHGTVAINASIDNEQNVILNLLIQPGWHINANQPLQEYLIPTSVQLTEHSSEWRILQANYPPVRRRKLGFQQNELAVYEGQIKIILALEKTTPKEPLASEQSLQIELQLQACSFSVCLPPEKLQLNP